MSRDDDLSDYEKQIVANVEKHGCHVTMVFDPDGKDPNFAYSAGFWKSAQQPEVITFGLSIDLMKTMIDNVHDQCMAGLALEDGVRIDGLLRSHACVARSVKSENIVRDYLNSAMWFHEEFRGEPLSEVVQLVWPGAQQGLYPWEEGCDELVISQQPALYETSMH
jgi:hypothetical protein